MHMVADIGNGTMNVMILNNGVCPYIMVKSNIIAVITAHKLHNLRPTAHDIQFHKIRIVTMRFQF